MADALQGQGKHIEAEQENRAVLSIQERVLGAENPDIFQSCYNLADSLKAQGKLAYAKTSVEQGVQLATKTKDPILKKAQDLLDELSK